MGSASSYAGCASSHRELRSGPSASTSGCAAFRHTALRRGDTVLKPYRTCAPAHVAWPNAAYALERAPECGLGLVAEPLGHLRHGGAAQLEHLLGEMHAPGGDVLHRRPAEQR